MKVVLIGANGQLGRCLQDIFPEDWEIHCFISSELDVTDFESVQQIVTLAPDVIINASAYTKVDLAETDVDQAYAVNAQGVYHLASVAKACGARFIHVSTDYVFDGTQTTPYKETDSPCPINVYGQSKLAGEVLALSTHVDTLILRTSWFYSEYGQNFLKTMLEIGKVNSHLKIVSDQIGRPTYAGDMASAIIYLILQHKNERGIINITGIDICSWAQFAEEIFLILKEIDFQYVLPCIEYTSTDDYQNIVSRPLNSVLDNTKSNSMNIIINSLSHNIRKCLVVLKDMAEQDKFF